MLQNQKGITLLNLMCGLAFGGVLYAFIVLPIVQYAIAEDKANLVISLAVHETSLASQQFHDRAGIWPTTKEQVAETVRLMRVEFVNPYDGGTIEYGLGRPKSSYDVAPGAIRFIPSTDGTNMTICGYGSGGRLIKETICLTVMLE